MQVLKIHGPNDWIWVISFQMRMKEKEENSKKTKNKKKSVLDILKIGICIFVKILWHL